MKPKRVSSGPALSLMFSMLLLGACNGSGGSAGGGGVSGGSSVSGGGGGSAPTVPDAPVLSLTLQSIKTFHFTWADVNGETGYRLLEDPDGVSGYTQVATINADTQSHDIVASLPGRINARYILQACNAVGCIDSAAVNVSGTMVDAIGYVKASNAETGDQFGYSLTLASDGNTLAVGAYSEAGSATGIDGAQADDSASYSGAVYVFSRSGASWSQQAYIKASNTGAGDYFGYSLALAADGNTLAVGAVLEDSSATGIDGNQTDDSAVNSGAVYVFSRSGASWSQQAYVKASNTGAGDFFGVSVALADDGNTLAVGAYGEDSNATGIDSNKQANNQTGTSGAVYVFSRSGASWGQQAYVKASNTGSGDQFGYSVALAADGNTLAVGAVLEDSSATGIDGNQTDELAFNSGAVYVFSRSGASWSQQAYVKASNTGTGDFFGVSVALAADGNTLAVGAYAEASSATGIDGAQADNSAGASGAVYVFNRSGASWSQQAYIKASNTASNDQFGYSVALTADGDTLAVGANREDSSAIGIEGNQADDAAGESGAVYVFSRSGMSWSQQAYVKASNTGSSDQFGFSIALAADGDTLAVGACGEASNATGIGGDQADGSAVNSGAVYLY